MRQIPLGTKGTFTLRVLPEHLANRFKDAMLPQVLATPVMILIMENAALSVIRPFLDISESAVGTAINVRHLAATPVGHDVRAEAEVVKVEGKRIEFKVSASDEMEEIGCGGHQRMVIDLRSFNERLPKKASAKRVERLNERAMPRRLCLGRVGRPRCSPTRRRRATVVQHSVRTVASR
jgi:fluoroacetyl-CoA thioesterase